MKFQKIVPFKAGEVREIASPSNEVIKAIRALEQKKYRTETGLFLAEGARTLIEALDLGHPPEVIIYQKDKKQEGHIQKICEAVKRQGGLLLEVTEGILQKLSARDNAQTILGVFSQTWLDINEAAQKCSEDWLVLEDVRDPGNLGTIIRSADAFGFKNLLLVGQCTDPFSLETVRATMGSLFNIHLAKMSFDMFLKFRKNFKGDVVGTSLQDAKFIEQQNWKSPFMIAMGNEQQGLSAAMRQQCTSLVQIPMLGRADSLNLAVATGITLYCARRK